MDSGDAEFLGIDGILPRLFVVAAVAAAAAAVKAAVAAWSCCCCCCLLLLLLLWLLMSRGFSIIGPNPGGGLISATFQASSGKSWELVPLPIPQTKLAGAVAAAAAGVVASVCCGVVG